MSVTLNEVALIALLETQEGPVGRYVEGLAGRIVTQAQTNVNEYFRSAPTLDVGQDVGLRMDGSTATVGIAPKPGTSGEKAQRMADKQADGSFPWLTRAVDTVRT